MIVKSRFNCHIFEHFQSKYTVANSYSGCIESKEIAETQLSSILENKFCPSFVENKICIVK